MPSTEKSCLRTVATGLTSSRWLKSLALFGGSSLIASAITGDSAGGAIANIQDRIPSKNFRGLRLESEPGVILRRLAHPANMLMPAAPPMCIHLRRVTSVHHAPSLADSLQARMPNDGELELQAITFRISSVPDYCGRLTSAPWASLRAACGKDRISLDWNSSPRIPIGYICPCTSGKQSYP